MSSVYDSRILNLVIFSPLLFAALVAFLPKSEKSQIRGITFVGMLVNLATCVWAWVRFVPGDAYEFQLEYRMPWVADIGLGYHIGVDGLAMTLLMLTGVLGPLVVLASWSSIDERVKEFHVALLLLQTAMLGAICSIDLLLFYVFFEAMLVPMYLLIGVWGSTERQAAAMKFFLYTLVGSLLMLIAILSVYFLAGQGGARSFDYASIYNGMLGANREIAQCLAAKTCDTGLFSATFHNQPLSPMAVALLRYGPFMFFAFALAFAIKVPMFPVHTWLPLAHVQAPVAGSMILAAVMLKMGTFGFWRFAVPFFPAMARMYQPVIATLAVIGIVYGAFMCLAQTDIKKLIAYSSVSHLGYCMLGMFAFTGEGATGSAYQMLNHGVSTGALFMLFGFLYERRHDRLMSSFGGIAKVMPVFTAFFVIVTFSSIAVPGTNGFIGEFLVLLGSFKSNLPLVLSIAATTAVVLGAAYMLWMVQKVFFGQLTHEANRSLKDLGRREVFATLPFLALILVMGLKPQFLLDVLNPSSQKYVARAAYGADGDTSKVQMIVRTLGPAVAEAPMKLRLVPGAMAVPSLQARDR